MSGISEYSSLFMMEASTVLTTLEEQLTCSICLKVFTDPKTLQCLHSFCLPCLNEMAVQNPQGTPLQCPECRENIHLPAGATFEVFPNSFYFNRLLELLAIENSKQVSACCGSCERNLPPVSFCFECGNLLCSECVNAHKNIRHFKRHKFVELDAFQDKDIHEFLMRPDSCTVKYHDQEVLEFFCKDCKTCICQKCVLLEHKLHKYVHVKKAADECKVDMAEAVSEVKAKIPLTQERITKTDERFALMEENIQSATGQVHNQIEQSIRILKLHEVNVVSQLENIHQSERRNYEVERDALEVQLAKLTNGVKCMEAVVERNLTTKIMNTHNSVIKRCTELDAMTVEARESREVRVKYVASKDFDTATTQLTPGRVVLSGHTDPSCSTAEGRGVTEATVGEQAEFVVTTKDSQGNMCLSEDDCVRVTIKSSSGRVVESAVQDQKDGHYTVQYTPWNVDSYQVMVTIRGQAVAGSPFHVRVTKREYKPLKTFGSQESGAGLLQNPCGIAVNSRGEVAVADTGNDRIQLFTSDGRHLGAIGSKGTANGQMDKPRGVAFDHQDNVIVADSGNHRVQVLTTTGEFIKKFGEEQLHYPRGVCVTTDGNIAVCSQGGKPGVKVFTQEGVLLMQFNDLKRKCSPSFVTYSDNNYIVSYAYDHCVSIFNKKGILLNTFGNHGRGRGQFKCPFGVVIDKHNMLLVCDCNNDRIQVFTREGQFVQKIGTRCDGLGQLNSPVGIAVSPTGHLLVVDNSEHRVQGFH